MTMENRKGNMAPGQQNSPSEKEPQGNPNRQSSDEIVEGARQEDQLDKLHENAPDGNDGKEIGAEPKAYQHERKDEDTNEKK